MGHIKQNSKNAWMFIAGIQLLAILFLGIAPYLFPACKHMLETANGMQVHMNCFWAIQAEKLLILPLLVAGLSAFVTKSHAARIVGALFEIAIAVVSLLLLQNMVIGVCASAGMACHLAKYVITGIDGVIIVICFIQIGMVQRQKKYEL